jgi:hypothetical protein
MIAPVHAACSTTWGADRTLFNYLTVIVLWTFEESRWRGELTE